MPRNDLSQEAKQTFQVLAMFATVLVVGIHYKSDIPNVAELSGSTWNELGQEFLFGGLARVAVPLFAFAAGLFYFRSDNGSLTSYQKKLLQRVRTLLVPYLLIGLIATTCLYLVKRIEGSPLDFSWSNFFSTWLLHPPAEQLWFLRDLMVLVLFAPVVRLFATHRMIRWFAVPAIGLAWLVNYQASPVIQGWHLIHMETLFFFLIGCVAVSHFDWIEKAGTLSHKAAIGWVSCWIAMSILRVACKPNFDLWYTNEWAIPDLLLHQFGIIVGCIALFLLSWRMRFHSVLYLSGASFFVYLIHEFPLRAVAERIGSQVVATSTSCWLLTPAVIVGCYSLAIVLFKFLPRATGVLTGGRQPIAVSEEKRTSPLSRKLQNTSC